MSSSQPSEAQALSKSFDNAYEMAQLLQTGLDRDTLKTLMVLLQRGVNPEALADLVKDLRKEAAGQEESPAASSRPSSGRSVTGKKPLSDPDVQVSQKKRRSGY